MNELQALQSIYEILGVWGVSLGSFVAVVLKTPYLRKKLFEYLFYTYIRNDDPKAQYAMLSQQIKYWIQLKGSILVFEDKGRQAIFQDLIHIKLLTFRTYIDDFYKNIENFRNGEEMYDHILNAFERLTVDIDNEQRQYRIPAVAIEKYQLWQRPSYQYTLSQLRNIAFSKAYITIPQKAEAMMGTLQTNIELSIVEAERTLQSLNGSLTGAEYKGFVCQPIKH